MKTIEDAAMDYASVSIGGEINVSRYNDFKSGVEFAQRWIPVSEELPEESNEVLVYNGNFKTIGFYNKNFKIELDQSIAALPRKWEYVSSKVDWPIISWRPIELK